jgi:hypothetical protein
MSRMFKAFPTIEFPSFLVTLGFEDISWGNDVCARAEIKLDEHVSLEAWCDYADPAERECEGHQYFCALRKDDSNDEEAKYFGYTNDLAEFEATIKVEMAKPEPWGNLTPEATADLMTEFLGYLQEDTSSSTEESCWIYGNVDRKVIDKMKQAGLWI